MPARLRRNPVPFLAAAILLAAGSPCAARGTGGFLCDWTVCGPLPGERLDAPALADDFAAWPGRFAAGGVWLPVRAEPRGRIDLCVPFPERDTGTALLFTFFKAPEEGRYHLRIGSDDAVRVDLDGRTVHTREVHRAWRADQDTVAVQLEAGWHRLLLRVVNHGGAWAASVRTADARDRPIDVPNQAACPPPLESVCRLDSPATVGERAEVADHLAEAAAHLRADLEAAVPPLTETPDGYVAFAEYRSARALARRCFEALAALWDEGVREFPNAERVRAEQHRAEKAARGFSEVLAREADDLAADLLLHHDVWKRLGEAGLLRRDLARATLRIARLIARTRRLAERIESERLLAARFENDIRNFRQRDLVVRVRDADGRPVPGAVVEIVQTGHDFPFGCNLFAFGRWGRKNRLYEQRFAHLFNLAVVPVYWSVIERHRGRPDYARLDAAVRWCRERGIGVRGHPLVWAEAVPHWADRLDAEALRHALRTHLARTVRRFRAKIGAWDVVHNPDGAARLGPAKVAPGEAVAWAAEADPAAGLLVTGDDPAALADAALADAADAADGRRPDAVGITAHQHDGAWSLGRIRRTIDAAARAGMPVHLSAVTILGDAETEAEQAEAVRHFYTAAFADRRVAGITWWDLSDRFAWRNADAGLLRADLSPKPAYHALEDLLHRRWRTDAAGRTDSDGRLRARVFLGTYRLTARADGREATRTMHLGREGPAMVEITLPPGR